ncbi:Hemin uptake protein HemP [Solilutibacter tolerans]|uniref:Hemin uptake protein HemP n=1 Tax=Solilutibacter tolerans TaxID=1604334 RepID=A0A1N6U7K8_9GAMM|nr:Hemin uptake protein HemP [Lysobacter tolerans]
MFDLLPAVETHAERNPSDRGDIPQSPVSSAALAMVTSRALLRGGRELIIRHGDTCYRLRHTRNDKLILTK